MIVLKARRKGYSYKAGSMLARNYFFVRNSKNKNIKKIDDFIVVIIYKQIVYFECLNSDKILILKKLLKTFFI